MARSLFKILDKGRIFCPKREYIKGTPEWILKFTEVIDLCQVLKDGLLKPIPFQSCLALILTWME